MNDTTKRVLGIIAFILFIAGIGFLLYYIFFRGLGGPPVQPDLTVPAEELLVPGFAPAEIGAPTLIEEYGAEELREGVTVEPMFEEPGPLPAEPVAVGTVTETSTLVEASVANVTLAGNGQDAAFYNQDTGKFYRVNSLGETELMTDQTFFEVQNVTWAPDTSKAILEYPDSSKIFYNFETRKQYTLPSNWEEFSFNESSERIVFKEQSDNANYKWIVSANPDGTEKKYINHMGVNEDKVIIDWSPNDQIVAMKHEPTGDEQTTLFFIGQNDENFKATYVQGYGLKTQWSESGDKLLYSAYSSKSDYNPMLWVVNASGDNIGTNRVSLGIQTWADKCAFADNNTLYCAVPYQMEYGTGLAPELAQDITDVIVKIDLTTGRQDKIAETDQGYSIKSLSVTDDQSTLYFSDYSTSQLHKLRLK